MTPRQEAMQEVREAVAFAELGDAGRPTPGEVMARHWDTDRVAWATQGQDALRVELEKLDPRRRGLRAVSHIKAWAQARYMLAVSESLLRECANRLETSTPADAAAFAFDAGLLAGEGWRKLYEPLAAARSKQDTRRHELAKAPAVVFGRQVAAALHAARKNHPTSGPGNFISTGYQKALTAAGHTWNKSNNRRCARALKALISATGCPDPRLE